MLRPHYLPLQDSFSYCYQSWPVILSEKTASYLTFSGGTGGIDERTALIIGDGIDHRARDQWRSAVLIPTVVVDEVKWLIVRAGG